MVLGKDKRCETEKGKPVQGCITDLKITVGNWCLILLGTSDEPFEMSLKLLPRIGVSKPWPLGLGSSFCKKVLLKHSHDIHICIFFGCFQAVMAELSSCNRVKQSGLQSLNYFLSGPLQKNLPTSAIEDKRRKHVSISFPPQWSRIASMELIFPPLWAAAM